MSSAVTVGAELPAMERTPTAVDLFLFSSAAWLAHRIHYDVPFTTEHDGHPGLLIHGPLQGVYLVQAARLWLGPEARLLELTYRHHVPAYLGDTLRCGGEVAAVADGTISLDVWVEKPDGTRTTSGRAVFAAGGEET